MHCRILIIINFNVLLPFLTIGKLFLILYFNTFLTFLSKFVCYQRMYRDLLSQVDAFCKENFMDVLVIIFLLRHKVEEDYFNPLFQRPYSMYSHIFKVETSWQNSQAEENWPYHGSQEVERERKSHERRFTLLRHALIDPATSSTVSYKLISRLTNNMVSHNAIIF